ncbi:uncharacterized protein ACNS7B_017290 isoform 1-T1 [Menidia menidia]
MSAEMDEQANPLERDHSLCVVLPGGQEKNATVHGSTPVMDLLITLCASYHLNPSDYTVEFLSRNKNNISFKPNFPVGLLEAEKIVLKPRGAEEKIKRPYMPEATVRLLINYNKSHKTVVRVSPRLPLEMLLPAVCDKCEFNTETTILLRDSRSKEPLDVTKSLNDLGLREVFARDTAARDPAEHRRRSTGAAVTQTEAISTPPPQELPKTERKQQNNRGFFSLFRRKAKKPNMDGASSAPASPGRSKQSGASGNSENIPTSNTLPADMPKKRRAPQPPMGASQSVPNNLSSCHLKGAQRSAECTLRSTKRRAPPPPCANTHRQLEPDTDIRDCLSPLEEERNSDECNSVNLSLSSGSSRRPSQSQPSSSSPRPSLAPLHEATDPRVPKFRGKDLFDARAALAKVLTSSVSKGTLAKRLRNSNAFSKFHVPSCVSRTPECPDDAAFCAELESAFRSNLPTGGEWEDPVEKRGVTTFSVVPPKTLVSCEAEVTVNFPERPHLTGQESPSTESPENNRPETGENPGSPDRPESESTFPSPEPASRKIQSEDGSTSNPPACDSDDDNCPERSPPEVSGAIMQQEEEMEPEAVSSDCGNEESGAESHINPEDVQEDVVQDSPCSGEEKVEEDAMEEEEEEEETEEAEEAETKAEAEEEISFPTPPPPVHYKEDSEKDGEEPAASSLPYFHAARPDSNGHAAASGDARNDDSTSAPAPQPADTANVAPSRFAQAVAMAIQRSRLLSFGKALGPQVSSTFPSAPRSTYQYGA